MVTVKRKPNSRRLSTETTKELRMYIKHENITEYCIENSQQFSKYSERMNEISFQTM